MKLLKDDIEMGIVTIKRWVTKGFTYSQIRGAVGRLLAGYIRLSTRKTLRYNRKLEKYLHRLITKWSVYSSNREVSEEMIEAFFRIDKNHPCKKAQ